MGLLEKLGGGSEVEFPPDYSKCKRHVNCLSKNDVEIRENWENFTYRRTCSKSYVEM